MNNFSLTEKKLKIKINFASPYNTMRMQFLELSNVTKQLSSNLDVGEVLNEYNFDNSHLQTGTSMLVSLSVLSPKSLATHSSNCI